MGLVAHRPRLSEVNPAAIAHPGARGGHCRNRHLLEHDVDDKACEAKYEDGILRLTLPKRKEAVSKILRIE